MFKLNPEPTFRAKVEIPVPGAKPEPVEFIFRHRTQKALTDWIKATAEAKPADIDFILEIVSGWAGVDAGFERETVEALLDNYHGAAGAIRDAYLRELTAARLKN